MAVHRIMDRNGDTRVEFDPADAVEVKEAMARFDDLVGNKKHFAYAPDGKGGGHQVKAFDPVIETTVFRPPLIGG